MPVSMNLANVENLIKALVQALNDGDPGMVRASVDKLLQAVPDSPQIHRLAGTALFRANRMDEACGFLSLPALSTAVEVQEMLVTAAMANGDQSVAKAAARRAVLLAPDNPAILRSYGGVSYRPGRLRRIIRTADHLGCFSPVPGAKAIILAEILAKASALRYDMCDLADAELLSRLALLSRPADVALLMVRAEILTDRFEPDSARKSAARAHLIATNHETEYPELIVLSNELQIFKVPQSPVLGVKLLAGGSLVPSHDDPVAGGMRAAVLGADGAAHDDALLRWNNKRLVHPATAREPVKILDGEYIFGGFLLHQYGHFVLETLARYWYIMNNPKIPVVFLGPINLSQTTRTRIGFFEWEERIFSFLGITPDRLRLVLDPVRIEMLHLPDAGVILRDTFHAEQADALGRFRTGPTKIGKKVWLSRAGKGAGDIDNELEVEVVLGEAGWTIACLHEMDFVDQLALLSDCERIAGFAASAFHTFVFLDRVGARVDIFSRNNRGFQTADTIARVKGFEQVIHCPRMIKSAPAFLGSRFRAEDPGEIIRALGL